MLESGDAFVFGGAGAPALPRRVAHPAADRAAALELDGRFNLTFRQFDVGSSLDADYLAVTRMATRLFRARPSGVELSAIGC